MYCVFVVWCWAPSVSGVFACPVNSLNSVKYRIITVLLTKLVTVMDVILGFFYKYILCLLKVKHSF